MSFPQNLSNIVLHIHSVDYALKCSIDSISDNMVSVTPSIGKVDMFRQNDPVVCMYWDAGVFNCKSGSIHSVDTKEKGLKVYVSDDSVFQERRLFERYPVSIALSARKKYQNKRLNFFANNISLYGICAVSEHDMEVDELVDIDLITNNSMFYLSGKVVWKKEKGNDNEYGMQLTHFDSSTASNFQTYLQKIRGSYEDMYNKAR